MALSLHTAALSFAASPVPALRLPASASVQPTMLQSQALPFLEAPPKLDGTLAGDVGFDPLNLSSYYSLDWMREAELKHGRVCMLAWLGFVVTDIGIYAPGAPHVRSLAAHDTCVGTGHMLLLLFVIAIPEALSYVAISQMMSGETDRKAGDYGIGWKFCKDDDTKTQEKYKLAEITHGRAAMMAFSGLVTHAQLFPDMAFPYGIPPSFGA